MTKIALILKNKTQPGKRDAVRALFDEHMAARAMANPKQEVVIWCDDLQDDTVFYLFEIYTSQAALQENMQPSEWFVAYMSASSPLLVDGAYSMVMAAPRWGKGVSV